MLLSQQRSSSRRRTAALSLRGGASWSSLCRRRHPHAGDDAVAPPPDCRLCRPARAPGPAGRRESRLRVRRAFVRRHDRRPPVFRVAFVSVDDDVPGLISANHSQSEISASRDVAPWRNSRRGGCSQPNNTAAYASDQLLCVHCKQPVSLDLLSNVPRPLSFTSRSVPRGPSETAGQSPVRTSV